MVSPPSLTRLLSGPATGIIAIDCEMVGVGTYGERSALARCSIVNVRGETVYDKFVKPIEKVRYLDRASLSIFGNIDCK